ATGATSMAELGSARARVSGPVDPFAASELERLIVDELTMDPFAVENPQLLSDSTLCPTSVKPAVPAQLLASSKMELETGVAKVPALKMPTPANPAVLPLRVSLPRVAFSALKTPPPSPLPLVAESPLKVLLVMTMVPPFHTPPPWTALSVSNVSPFREAVAPKMLKNPPPSPVAVLPLTVSLPSVTLVPLASTMPAPSTALPPVIFNPVNVTVPELIVTTVLAVLAVMEVVEAAAPAIVNEFRLEAAM